MPFFRRPFDRRHAVARPAAPHDTVKLEVLANHASRRYLTSPVENFIELLPTEPTAVLEYDERIVAVAQAGWRMPPNAWLRSVLVDSRIDASYALPLVVQQVHHLLPVRGISAAYITLDDWSAPWLHQPLTALGYKGVMEVWSYDKMGMDLPATGNQAVLIRRAQSQDLSAILQLDVRCFPTPWGKGKEILAPAIMSSPYFSIAELGSEIVGYTYVTMHHAGLQAHLVRIAVAPDFQGQGIGVRLLAEVVRFCQHRHIELLSLNTQDYNVAAQRLYEWFGFRRTGESQIVLGASIGASIGQRESGQ